MQAATKNAAAGTAAAEGARGVVRIAILKTGAGYRVRPSYVVVGKNTDIRFVNLTQGPVDVSIPAEMVDGKGNRQQVLAGDLAFSVDANSGKTCQLSLSGRARGPLRFPYSVYSHWAKDFLQGESSPEIIVDEEG